MTLGGRTPECKVCGEKKDEISKELGVCVKCIRNNPEMAHPHLVSAHTTIREPINLPSTPPRTGEGLSCSLCSNQCVMGEGEKGYCGLRWNTGGMQSLVEMDIGLLPRPRSQSPPRSSQDHQNPCHRPLHGWLCRHQLHH